MNARTSLLLAAAAGAALATGCLSKGDVVQVRYFRPLLPEPPVRIELAERAASPAIRFGAVEAASHLKERMVWQTGEVEYGFYEDRRWTELPARFVMAALERELFVVHGFRHSSSADAPRLDVFVAAFEEVIEPEHEVAVELVFTLEREQNAIEQQHVGARRPLASAEPEELARAMGEALAEAIGAYVGGLAPRE